MLIVELGAQGNGSLQHVQAKLQQIKEPPKEMTAGQDCKCKRCRKVEDPKNQICCGRTDYCITEDRLFFKRCLDKDNLDNAIGTRTDKYGLRREYTNTGYRFQAYREFVKWVAPEKFKVGAERVPPPACVLWRVRDEYPKAAHEQYKGFKPSTAAENVEIQ